MELTEWKRLIQEWTGMDEEKWKIRERILSVSNKVDNFRHEEMCVLLDIIQPFALRGLRSMVAEAVGDNYSYNELDEAKMELENTLVQQKIPREEYLREAFDSDLSDIKVRDGIDSSLWQAVEKMARSGRFNETQLRRWDQAKVAKVCQQKLDRLWNNKKKYHRWLEQIQINEGVSGICPNEEEVMGEMIIFPYYRPESGEAPEEGELYLIPSDLPILSNWKWTVADKFLSLGYKHNCNYYFYDKADREAMGEHDRLKRITPEEILKWVAENDKVYIYQVSYSGDRTPYFQMTLSSGLKVDWTNTLDIYAITDGKKPSDIVM